MCLRRRCTKAKGEALDREASVRFSLLLLFCLGLGGCGVVAAPCRVASGVVKAVPLVGHVAAAPTDACAGVIDPDSVSQS